MIQNYLLSNSNDNFRTVVEDKICTVVTKMSKVINKVIAHCQVEYKMTVRTTINRNHGQEGPGDFSWNVVEYWSYFFIWKKSQIYIHMATANTYNPVIL